MLLCVKHAKFSKAAQHCENSLSFTSVSSTKSVCVSESRGAQGGSALPLGGNSFRKYQTARHTQNPQSLFLLNDRPYLLFRRLKSSTRLSDTWNTGGLSPLRYHGWLSLVFYHNPPVSRLIQAQYKKLFTTESGRKLWDHISCLATAASLEMSFPGALKKKLYA